MNRGLTERDRLFAQPSTAYLDLTILEGLRNIAPGGDVATFLRELLELFTEHAALLVDQIEAAIKNEDDKKLAFLCHRLKGLSFNIGAKHLGDLSEFLSQCVKDENYSDKLSVLEHLANVYKKTIALLQAHIH